METGAHAREFDLCRAFSFESMQLCPLVVLSQSQAVTSCFIIPLADIGSLVEKIDDPNMANDADLLEVVRLLDNACKEAGFFYVVSTC